MDEGTALKRAHRQTDLWFIVLGVAGGIWWGIVGFSLLFLGIITVYALAMRFVAHIMIVFGYPLWLMCLITGAAVVLPLMLLR